MWTRVMVAAWLIASAGSARAEKTLSVETHGIELEVPVSWAETQKGAITVLAPKAHKGRALEVMELASMPEPTNEGIGKLLGSDKFKATKTAALERYGYKVIRSTGKTMINKEEVDVDLLIVPQAKGATMIMSFIRADQDPELRDANERIMLSARTAGPKMKVFVKPTKTKGLGAPKDFEVALGAVATKLDALIMLPRPLPIIFEDCGQANAFYSASEHNIRVCHELWDDMRMLFAGVGDKAQQEELVRATVLFVFFHEFGHALAGELELPITGKGEDDADEVATLLLVQSDSGRKAAKDAARWFEAMLAKKRVGIWWDEHSFNDQRAMAIWCMLYATDDYMWKDFLKAKGVPAERLAKCKRDYASRKKAWDELLAPHTRRVAKK